MKRIELIFALCMVGLLFAYPVWAAEGPSDAAYNWSGFYLGAHGGVAWSYSSSNTTNTATGANTGYGSSSKTNGSGGIQLGNDFLMTRNILVGLDLRASYLGATNDETTSSTNGTVVHTTHGTTDWTGSVTGRVGYVFQNWLFYGRGGVIFDQGDITRRQVAGTVGMATPGTSEKVSNNRVGWTVGAGTEYGFAPGWSAFIEYRYNANTNSVTFPIAQRSTSTDSNSNAIAVGVNYKFNWGSPLFGGN